MPKQYLAPKNGSATFPSGFAMDTQSYTMTESQNVEDITVYGAMAYAQNRGSGTPRNEVSAIGFGYSGAAGSPLGFAGNGPSGGMAGTGGDTGTTATFRADGTSGTPLAQISGSYVVRQIRMEHSRVVAAVRCAIDLVNASDLTVTWALA